MKVKIFGIRGSMSVSSPENVVYGGNTTCLQISSSCIPSGVALAVDAGTGLLPLSMGAVKAGLKKLVVLMTHWHHDHTQGITMAPHTFMGDEVVLYGPEDHGIGPKEVMEQLMKEPFFPVNYKKVKNRFTCKPMDNIGTEVIIIHPKHGIHKIQISEYHKAVSEGEKGRVCNGRCLLSECLVVLMYRTTHPEQTISYRFIEMPTQKTFVFLTDHECTAAFPTDLVNHVKNADVLIVDGQYSKVRYDSATAGFGHATPEYCAQLAHKCNVKTFGITHHDPFATDSDVEMRLEEAKAELVKLGSSIKAESIFACACYQEVEV